MSIKAIQTEYKGYLFRSRLEARWAVFFDACGVEWEYEPEGYSLGDGIKYLPDFLLHGVRGRAEGDLYVEVKGNMTDTDAEKIKRFAYAGKPYSFYDNEPIMPILVVGKIPEGDDICDIINYIADVAYSGYRDHPNEFNFQYIDGDYFGAHPGINKDGYFELFGDDNTYLNDMDEEATEKAYRKARQARFEFNEKGGIKN